MAFTNNIMIVRHKLLTELVKLWKNGELTTDKIDRLPLELSPRRSKHAGRCCVHKERAVWKYKSLPLLGLDMDDETDELTSLSEYAARALDRAENGMPKDNIMCVIDPVALQELADSISEIGTAPLAYRLTTKLPTCVADVPPAAASTTAPKELFMYMQTPAKHGLTTTPVSVVASATKVVLIMPSSTSRFPARNPVLSRLSAKTSMA